MFFLCHGKSPVDFFIACSLSSLVWSIVSVGYDISQMMNLCWLHIDTYPSDIGYLAEEQTHWRWNLTDEPSVLAAHWNLPSVLVTHRNLLQCNNASYPCAERLYNHLVVCEHHKLCRELSVQTTALSLKSREHMVKGRGITNSFQDFFLAIARRY